jgi:hypothetical protein
MFYTATVRGAIMQTTPATRNHKPVETDQIPELSANLILELIHLIVGFHYLQTLNQGW